jgi:MerR family transcriptional regulator, light-induced transcriptional regulator
MIRYSIRDLEKITGIKAHTIRIWEKRYGIVEPARTQTNIRYYSDHDLRLLMNVATLNKYGYKISNIQTMSAEEISQSVLQLNKQDLDNEHEIDSLVMAMIEMDEPRFDKIITSAILKHGFEYTFETLLSKFLEKIGVLWQVGNINPAQEHFISQLIRQKLILAIDAQNGVKPAARTFLLFLPEGEYHEMALLYLHFLIRKEQHSVIYLGQNVPLSNLKNIFDIHPIDYLLTSVSSNLSSESMPGFINELVKLYPEKQILIGGKVVEQGIQQDKKQITFFSSLEEFHIFIKTI